MAPHPGLFSVLKRDRARRVVFAELLLLQFLLFVVVSVVAPFFPDHLRKYDAGITEFQLGVMFSLSPSAVLVFSPFAGVLCSYVARKHIVGGGLLGFALSSIIFGCGKNLWAFCLARLGQGISTAFLCTSVLGILADSFPYNVSAVMAVYESVIGLSFIAGPVISATLVNWGGFSLPFIAVGAVLLALCPIVLCHLHDCPAANLLATRRPSATVSLLCEEQCNSTSFPLMVATEEEEEKERVPPVVGRLRLFCRLFSLRLLSVALSAALVSIIYGYFDPFYSDHVRLVLCLPQSGGVGYLFATNAAGYAAISLLLSGFVEKMNRRATMLAGMALTSVSLFSLGPAPVQPLPAIANCSAGMWIVQVSAAIGLGVGTAVMLVPVLSEALHSARLSLERAGRTESPNAVTDSVTSVYNSMYAVGQAGAPLFGGVLQHLGFPTATMGMAAAVVVFSLLFCLEMLRERMAR